MDIKLGVYKSNVVAWVDQKEIHEGKNIIYIGTIIDNHDTLFKRAKKEDTSSVHLPYRNCGGAEEIYHNFIESILTHETLHIVLHKIAGEDASVRFDIIDQHNKISSYGWV